MTSLDGLHRTTMFTETVNDIECEEKKAVRAALQEMTKKYEAQKTRIRELEDALYKKPRYVFVDKSENLVCPPWGS